MNRNSRSIIVLPSSPADGTVASLPRGTCLRAEVHVHAGPRGQRTLRLFRTADATCVRDMTGRLLWLETVRRSAVRDASGRIVALDEDGLLPPDYGIEALALVSIENLRDWLDVDEMPIPDHDPSTGTHRDQTGGSVGPRSSMNLRGRSDRYPLMRLTVDEVTGTIVRMRGYVDSDPQVVGDPGAPKGGLAVLDIEVIDLRLVPTKSKWFKEADLD